MRIGIGALAFSSDDRWIISTSYDGTVKYWNSTTGKLVATFSAARDGRWIVITEAGFFAGSPGSDDLVNIVRGLTSLPVTPFREQLYRPDLVEQLLRGDPEHGYAGAAEKLDLAKLWDSNASPPNSDSQRR